MTESFPLIEEVSRERLRKLDPLLTHLSLLSVNCRYDFLFQDFYFRLRIQTLAGILDKWKKKGNYALTLLSSVLVCLVNAE